MNFEINIFILFMLIGSVQGLFLASILVLNKRFKKKSNVYLAVFILAFSLSNLHYIARAIGVIEAYSWLNYLTFPWTFLIPIVFYFFIKYLLNPDHELTKRERWLYLPFLIQVIFHLVLFVLDFFNYSILETYKDAISLLDIKLETILSLVINLIFIPLIYKMLQAYDKDLKENYADISQSSIQWIKRLLIILIGIWVIWAMPAIYQIITGNTTPMLDYVLWVMMSVCIYWIGYEAYFRNDIFQPQQSFPSKETTVEETEIIQNLPDKTDEHFDKMIQLIESEKLYTNPAFDLSMLAQKTGLSANYLSQIINKQSGQNFYTLINDYRTEEVKKMLLNPDYSHYSILSIGLEAGFKSKSSFYKVFKEKTGMTPAQFQKG